MRKYDFTNSFGEYFALNDNYNTRDDMAVRRTFSGLAKLIYPDENMTKDEAREAIKYIVKYLEKTGELNVAEE